MILIVDFGSQYTHLIARRVQELGAETQIVPPLEASSAIDARRPRGIILSGGPASVYEPGAPMIDPDILAAGIPILGICYGQQLIAQLCGGKVVKLPGRGYGKEVMRVMDRSCVLFAEGDAEETVWVSHGDTVVECPSGFRAVAESRSAPIAAFVNASETIFGVQFHPEVSHTKNGGRMLRNFITRVCGISTPAAPQDLAAKLIGEIQTRVGNSACVLAAVSGGVDSTVVAFLLKKALGPKRTIPVFVDNGLLRKGEAEEMSGFGKRFGFPRFVELAAAPFFLKDLTAVINPERKRHVVGKQFFIRFKEIAKHLREEGFPVEFFAQGTLYPDRIESAGVGAGSARIKQHHNLVAVPEDFGLIVLEPLRDCYKDEVRGLAGHIGVPEDILNRHPFPGPGLAVRILGEVTEERLAMVREADAIFREELTGAGQDEKIWQAFAALIPVRTVGVMGDARTYAHVIVLRAVTSADGMTADAASLPNRFLTRVANRIVNEVKDVNRVLYDLTQKPPATIEYE